MAVFFTFVLFIFNIYAFPSRVCATKTDKNTNFETIMIGDIERITKKSCIVAGLSFSENLNDKYLNVLQMLQLAFEDEPNVRIALLKQDKDLFTSVKWDSNIKPSLSNGSLVFFQRIKPDRVCLSPKPEFVPFGEVCMVLLYVVHGIFNQNQAILK